MFYNNMLQFHNVCVFYKLIRQYQYQSHKTHIFTSMIRIFSTIYRIYIAPADADPRMELSNVA